MEDRRIRTLGRRAGATLVTLGMALGGFGVFASSAGAAAPGNNGTVKIREAGTADDDVSNDPHIKCLEAAWYGFDAAPDVATFDVTFINPTAGGDVQHFADQITLSAPDVNDLNGKFQPAIDTTGVDPTNKGEWHVRVDIDTNTSNGAIPKSKDVWITNECGTDGGGENPQSSSATIQVSKALTGNNQPNNPANFSFAVSCTTGTVTSSPISVAAGGSSTATVSWDGDTAPSCTVTESNPQGATSTSWSVGNGAATTGTAASTGVLTDGATTQVAFTNDYTRQIGGCQVNCGPIPVVVDIPVTTTVPTPPTTEAPRVEPEVVVPPVPTTEPAKVEGVQIVAPAPPAQVQPAQLARTGAMTDRLVVAAGLCLLLGGVVLAASKERTAVPARRR